VAEAATLAGLSATEVDQRRRAGRVNVVARRSSRSAWSIVRANVLTRFNAILGVLLVVVLCSDHPSSPAPRASAPSAVNSLASAVSRPAL
jgi:cation-transporting P-type ATPase E